jgi:uncharacterized protein (TIGR03435 family)
MWTAPVKTKLALLLVSGCIGLAAQPAFEAASIHPNNEADRPGRPIARITPGTLTMRNQALVYLIQWAWDIPRVQIEGPSWLREVWFDITAKAGTPAVESELRLMLRRLLADRFGLKFHKEPRFMPVYALTLTKDGPKFREAATEGAFSIEPRTSAVFVAHHARMADLAQGLADEAGRPVIDATGLHGQYDLRMDLTPYLRDGPGLLFTGLQDLLGLKLEPRKTSVEVLVIDHVEKTPTAN